MSDIDLAKRMEAEYDILYGIVKHRNQYVGI